MNRIIIIILLVLTFFSAFSQKYAYVDTDYILENIPEYKDAQAQLDEVALEFQKEIEDKYAEVDKMYKAFQAESVLMPEDIKKKKGEEITAKEKEIEILQKKRFGKDGDLFAKREELVKPIQEKIYNAIEEISVDNNYAFVFDKAGSLTLLYVNSKFDISDDVLDKVGAVLGTVRKEDRVRKDQPQNQNQSQPQINKQDQKKPDPKPNDFQPRIKK